jgi:hypothetical protein
MTALHPLPPAAALRLGGATGALRISLDSIWPGLLALVVSTEPTRVAPGPPGTQLLKVAGTSYTSVTRSWLPQLG